MTGRRKENTELVSKMLREHLEGIVNAVVLGATNVSLESVNSKIQALKKRACGFRNRDRFRTGLDLYPNAQLAHTKP
jgi:transposase